LKIKTSESQIALCPQLCLLTVRQDTQLQTADLSYCCDSDECNN